MNVLICPLCSQSLIENSQGVACENRHQFDRAREGYFNLLPVQHKNSREPGDAKKQLVARRQFLNAGYFFPLVEKLKEIIDPNTTHLLDIGCGEGYFTRSFHLHCPQAQVYGIDISKAGIQLAAKACSNQEHYLVASSHLLPIADQSMDVITRIYAPSKDEELKRTLKPEGILIIVTPGAGHLLGLRQQIYKTVDPHPSPTTPVGFVEVEQYSISFPVDISPGDMTDSLLTMTPFSWKLSKDLRELLVRHGLNDEADFQITVYRKL